MALSQQHRYVNIKDLEAEGSLEANYKSNSTFARHLALRLVTVLQHPNYAQQFPAKKILKINEPLPNVAMPP
uniref:Uncharacterized protein n=1 Tax=Globodera rostochiensis TaxID=31243 RepID=A0A914H7B9_GLORO